MDIKKILVGTNISEWVSSESPIVKPTAKDGSSFSKAATSPDSLMLQGKPEGTYWFKSPSMSAPKQLFYSPNMVDGRSWVRVFSSPYNSTATVNEIGNNIDFEGFLIERSDTNFRSYSYFSTKQLFNQRSTTTTTTGGNKGGFRVYIGFAGGHGFYNTTQGTCSWSDSSGSIGSGWNGSTCGSFPNGLLWGTGQGGNPVYANLSGTWQTWIWWS
jgi:hypothetical protein